jgi:hypothetical protein
LDLLEAVQESGSAPVFRENSRVLGTVSLSGSPIQIGRLPAVRDDTSRFFSGNASDHFTPRSAWTRLAIVIWGGISAGFDMLFRPFC